MSDPASSFACRVYLRQHQPRLIEKGPTRGRQFDPASAARQELGA